MTGCRETWRGLLVSVRDAAEAVEAVAGGASIIDVKEPAHGPLGQATAEVVAAVATAVAGRLPWTMACGELHAGAQTIVASLQRSLERLPAGTSRPSACKAGPAGMTIGDWCRCFAAFKASVPAGIEPVAVAYADWHPAGAAAPDEIIVAAAAAGAETLLIDTFDKTGPGLLATGMGPAVERWIAMTRHRRLRLAIAGRLTLGQIASAAALGPDVVAVRSAVCDDGRFGTVRRALVAQAAHAAGRVVFPAAVAAHGVLSGPAPRLDTIGPTGADGTAAVRPGEFQ